MQAESRFITTVSSVGSGGVERAMMVPTSRQFRLVVNLPASHPGPGSWTNAERGGGLAISHRFFGCPQTSIALHGLLRGEAVEQAVATRRPQQFLAARTAIVS